MRREGRGAVKPITTTPFNGGSELFRIPVDDDGREPVQPGDAKVAYDIPVMQTITFFADKGGSGRTVSTVALASGFLAQGKRGAVMDYGDLAGCKASPLRS